MRQIKLLALAAMALMSLAGILVASASAELPNILPEEVITAKTECLKAFTFGNELIHLTTQEKEGCVGTQETTKNGMTGTFVTLFLGVKISTGAKCHTGLLAAGLVEVKGTFDTQFYLNAKSELKVASVTRPAVTTIKCEALEIVIQKGSCTAGQLTPTDELVKMLTLTFTVPGKDNEPVAVIKLEHVGEETENCENQSKTDTGAVVLSNQTGVIDVKGFLNAKKESVTVLLMSK